MNSDKRIILAIAVYAAVMVMILHSLNADAQEKDPVKSANARNEEKWDANIVDEELADFLVKSSDARMMDAEEGKVATEKGTTTSIREYGQLR